MSSSFPPRSPSTDIFSFLKPYANNLFLQEKKTIVLFLKKSFSYYYSLSCQITFKVELCARINIKFLCAIFYMYNNVTHMESCCIILHRPKMFPPILYKVLCIGFVLHRSLLPLYIRR